MKKLKAGNEVHRKREIPVRGRKLFPAATIAVAMLYRKREIPVRGRKQNQVAQFEVGKTYRKREIPVRGRKRAFLEWQGRNNYTIEKEKSP